MSLEDVEKLVAKWQVEHSEALSQAKGETDDQAYIGWMRLAAVTRNHMIELEAALRGEGQGDARLDEAKLRAALDADGLSRLECGHVKYNLIGDDWGNFSCDACAAAPSLHKEGVSPKALKALLDEIEDNECVCGAARAHRTMHNWAYCSLHARLDKVWKLFVDAQDAAASPAGRAEQV